MILSRNFLNKIGILLAAGFFLLSGCGGMKTQKGESPHRDVKFSIAVFPVENLSGTAAPLKSIKASLMNDLQIKGFHVIEEDALERFMVRNRVRYVGGIDQATAQALQKETGADGVLITSLELYSEASPPKVALTSRLVSTGENPIILWIDSAGLAGDDSPGILGLGLIENPEALLKKALAVLAGSLDDYFIGRTEKGGSKTAKKKFNPRISYRSLVLDPGRKYSVAVIPFFNRSERKNAGEAMVLHFVKNLIKLEQIEVIEPGVVRQQFLILRMIMNEGISIPNADMIFATLNVDLILTGDVIDYQDYQGTVGKPKVDFFAQLIERRSRKVVWSSVSHNEGDDGVFFFDWGRVNTAHAMASQMVQWIGNMVVKK
jgi:TolB-like protein